MVTLIAVPCGSSIVTLMSKAWDLRPLGGSGLRDIFTIGLDCSLSPTYVDDFKMAGPKGNLASGWSLLQKGLVIETPVPIGIYLGCGHEGGTMKVGGIVARTMTYDMEDFLASCVDRYLELAGNGVKLRTVATPFLVEDQGTSPQGAPNQYGPFSECPWCNHTFPAHTHKPAKDSNLKAAVSVNGSIADNNSNAESATGDVYISSSNIEAQCDHNYGVEVRAVPAQSCKENGGTPPPSPDEGRLQPIAAKVLMKILCAARLCRFDLLRAVCHLAIFVTKWTSECDRELHRLVS